MPNRFKEEPKKKTAAFSPSNTERELTPGASLNPKESDKPVVNWWGGYIQSPKYKQRLAAFYKYPEHIQNIRYDVLNNMAYRDNPGPSSRYYENGNEVAISNLQAQALNAKRSEILSHEIGHSVNSNSNVKGATLTPREEEYILQRNKKVPTDVFNRFKNMSKEHQKPLGDILTEEWHDLNPRESLSDIQSFRYLLKQRKIYDAGTQDVTPEILRKAAQDPVIKKSFTWKRLIQSFDEKSLREIMNAIAINKGIKDKYIS